MLKFQMSASSRSANPKRLRNAYLIGSDHSALRGEINVADGMVSCHKREMGVAALVSQQSAGDCGELTLPTCLLPDRDRPYLLTLELARHRLMMVYNKLEEWGMFDLSEEHSVQRRVEKARKLFIEALCRQSDNLAEADKLAQECLVTAIDASEELAVAHAELLLNRRRTVNSLPKHPFGCGVNLYQNHERLRAALVHNFDFVALPTPWRLLAPTEDQYRWELIDSWVDWSAKARVPLVAGPVISFESTVLPDWIYIWEHDYETVRDLLYEHAEQVINRYKGVVTTWKIISGLHVNSQFPFTFDQLMELTRMCCLLARKLHPQGRIMVELRQPFGEYYATNTRSIPPLMYTDLLVQNQIPFDVLALRMPMGQAQPGQYTRDLMQFSSLLDEYGSFGKPVYLTIGAPSEPVSSVMLPPAKPNEPVDSDCGYWRKPWSPLVQSRWLETMHLVALSKPFVEGVAWSDLADHPEIDLPLSGLVSEDMQPKLSFRRLVAFRRNLQSRATPATGEPPAPPSAAEAHGPMSLEIASATATPTPSEEGASASPATPAHRPPVPPVPPAPPAPPAPPISAPPPAE